MKIREIVTENISGTVSGSIATVPTSVFSTVLKRNDDLQKKHFTKIKKYKNSVK